MPTNVIARSNCALLVQSRRSRFAPKCADAHRHRPHIAAPMVGPANSELAASDSGSPRRGFQSGESHLSGLLPIVMQTSLDIPTMVGWKLVIPQSKKVATMSPAPAAPASTTANNKTGCRSHPPASELPEAGGADLRAGADERPADASALLASVSRLARGLLRTRLGLVLTAAAVVAGGLALGWEWLALVGVLPLLLSVSPCVAMCALGLCMMKGKGGNSCSSPRDSGGSARAEPTADRL